MADTLTPAAHLLARRAFLDAQERTIAQAIYLALRCVTRADDLPTWDALEPGQKETYLRDARKALGMADVESRARAHSYAVSYAADVQNLQHEGEAVRLIAVNTADSTLGNLNYGRAWIETRGRLR